MASADAENPMAVSGSPRVRELVRRLSGDGDVSVPSMSPFGRSPRSVGVSGVLGVSESRDAALLARVERLEAERDELRDSVERLERKRRRRKHLVENVSSDAAPTAVVARERRESIMDASPGSSARVDDAKTKTKTKTKPRKEDATLRRIFFSALTRAFGVSAFLAMAAALLLAAVDIFDIVDPAAPIGATEHSGRLTGTLGTRENVDRLDWYWERDTGPTGRAARSMLKLPKEMFVRAVADAKNALFSAWLSGHARENEEPFEHDDLPVPAPS